MDNHQLVLVLDFGGQYNQLIARRVREHNVYCEVKPYKTPLEEIRAMHPIGIIFTGGPNSVYDEKRLHGEGAGGLFACRAHRDVPDCGDRG